MESLLIVYSSYSSIRSRERASRIPPRPTGAGPSWLMLGHVGLFFAFFALLKLAAKLTPQKHRKKYENRGFGCPKTLPKPIQNPSEIDAPKNIQILVDICLEIPLLQKRRHRFRIGFSNTKWLSDTFLHVAFLTHFRSEKPTKKPYENQARTLQKSAPKTCCCLASVFSGLGLHFGVFWVSKLEPS